MTARWGRLMVAIGVSTVVGLAPWLGVVKVAGFTALLSMFPRLPHDMTRTLIPLSSFLMGFIAAAVQFSSRRMTSSKALARRFAAAGLAACLSLLLLVVVHGWTVRDKPIPATNETVAVLTGFGRTADCPCAPSISDVECLDTTTLDPGRILSCWGERQIAVAGMMLSLLYLVLTGSFGVVVGLTVLSAGAEPANPRRSP